jgi:putative DNA primase/helicase
MDRLIVGKNIIYSTEQLTLLPTVVDNLNKIVSGEVLNIEEKYEMPYNYKPYAKLFWASTDLPRFPPGDGFYRRFKVIKLPHLPHEDQDIDIKDRISREGPGIMNWALEGLQRLMERGHFEIPTSVKSATEEYEVANDTFQEFIDERCQFAVGVRTQASVLQAAYSEWCIANGYEPMSAVKLAEQWGKRGLSRTAIGGRRYWVGISLQPIPVFVEKEEIIYSLN